MQSVDRNILFSSEEYKPFTEFWKDKLSEADGSFMLGHNPVKKEKAARKSISFAAEEAVAARIFQMANNNELGVFVMLTSLFNVLFSNYSRSGSIIIRTPLYNGNKSAKMLSREVLLIERAIPNETLKELIIRLQRTVPFSYKFQHFPLHDFILRENAGEPLSSNVFISYEPVHEPAIDVTADLNIFIKRNGNSLEFKLDYDPLVFNDELVRLMPSHFRNVLSYLNSVNTPVNEIEILTPEEARRLTIDFNDTKTEFPSRSVLAMFEEQAAAAPSSIALHFEGKQATYRELNEKANQLARFFQQKRNVQPGDLVGILLDRSEWMIISMLAILKSGAAYLPLDTAYPQNRVDFIVQDSGVRTVIAEERFIDKLDVLGKIGISTLPGELENFDRSNLPDKYSLSSVAYVIYTSGSTGKPKGCEITSANFSNYISWAAQHYFGASQYGNFGLYTSIAFDLTITSIFCSLTLGRSLWIYNSNEEITDILAHSFSPDSVIDSVKITPAHISLLKSLSIKSTNVKKVIVGGEQLTPDQVSILESIDNSIEVFNEYGPTETAVGCIVKKIEAGEDPILIGKPIANTKIYILNSSLKPVPAGVFGEICISGSGVGNGYLNRAELTAEKFISDPFSEGSRMYRTGDLGRWLADGNIEFLGRIDTQVKIRGYRIELGEIEKALLGFSGIKEAVVVDDEDDSGVKFLAAYIVTDASVNIPELRNFLSADLSEYMIPSSFFEVERIPLSSNGKVDRRALKQSGKSIATGTEYAAPVNDLQEKLVLLWQQVLGKDKIGINDNFFELGGHSLKATQLAYRITGELNVSLELRSIFSAPTIRQLSEIIEANDRVEHHSIPQIPAQERYDLSNAQKRLWVLSQFEDASVAYNLPSAYMLEGELDKEAFQKAYLSLIERHESLRTIFVTVDDIPKQKVLSITDRDFELHHLDISSEPSKDEKINQLVNLESSTVFDLSQGPLVKAKLVQLSAREFVFLFTMHHIISDGWSMGVIVSDLLAIYDGYRKQTGNPLDPLRIHYKDYSAWQNENLGGEKLSLHRSYWLDKMRGELPVLDLPLDKSRPKVQTFNGDMIEFSIDSTTTDALKQLAQAQGGTLFMALISAVNSLLYKYTGQTDIIIGSPIAGRSHADLENQVGLYMNVLALRTKVDPHGTFIQLLDNVKQTTLEAYEHQVYPFDKLVDEMQLERDLSRSPLFDVVVMLQNLDVARGAAAPGSGLKVTAIEKEHKISKFDITFNFVERDGGIDADIEFNTDLFTREKIDNMAGHFLNLVSSIVAHSNSKIIDLEYIPGEERNKLLHSFNDTALDYEKNKTIVDLFEEQVRLTPNAIAIVFENIQLTYSELNKKANRFAAYLRSKGVTTEDLVGVYMDRSAEMVIGLLAIMKAGGAYVPLDPAYPKDRIAYIIEDSAVKLIVSTKKLINGLSAFEGVKLSIDSEETEGFSSEDVPSYITSANLAYVIYTSGSTGNPKGVLIEHRSVINFFKGMDQRIGNDKKKERTLLNVTSISFDISVLELFWTLTSGFKVVIHPSHTKPASTAVPKSGLGKTDFSLFYFASGEDQNNKYRMLLEGAKFADSNGFSAVWTPERHFHEFGGIFPNPSVTGAAVAAITKNIQVRSGSCVLPLHNPIRVAEEWSVVDNISNGRVGLSFATGWVLNDFLAFAPSDYDRRHEKMYKDIETVKHLWKGGTVNLSSNGGKDAEVRIYPKPIQEELPVWITAAGNPDTFRSAGKMGANLLTHLLGQSVEDLAVKVKVYRDARAEAGHTGEGIVSLMIHTFIGEDIETVKEQCREPFCNYLRSAAGLVRNLAQAMGQDIDADGFTDEDMNALLNHAFNRYYNTAALLGTPESCLELVNKLSSIGVNDIACLIDFGVDHSLALQSLEHLNTLKAMFVAQQDASFSSLSESVKKHNVTHLQCTPSAMNIMLMEENADINLRSIEKLMLGGEALPFELVKEIHSRMPAEIHNMYGPTETTIWSATSRIEKDDDKVTIGKPIANTQIYILDKEQKLVPAGVEGEIFIGGDGVARGYLNRPELTAERFVKNGYGSGRFYKTGDVGRWKNDGRIVYTGRNDEQVKIRGHRIELGEIESRLNSNDKIKEAVVIARGDAEKELVAYIVASGEVTAEELRIWLGQGLPEYMIPNYFVSLDAFPLTPNGKIDKKKLPAAAGTAVASGVSFEAPASVIEEMLADTWRELLGLQNVGVNESFFRIGGDSIKAIQVVSRLRQKGLKLEVRDIFNYTTIKELAPRVQGGARAIDQSLVTGRFDLTPIQHWHFETYDGGESHYNHTVLLRFGERIDSSALHRAMSKIYEHHDVLRASFKADESGTIKGFISPSVDFTIDTQDFSGKPGAVEIMEAYSAEVQTGISLGSGPLIKVVHFRLDDADRLLIAIHHLVVDGISWRVLFEDINLAYTKAVANEEITLPLKTDSFRAWSEALAKYSQDEFLLKQVDYWKKVEEAAVPAIPVDHVGADNLSMNKAEASVSLSAELTTSLLTKANEAYNTEINDLLLTGFGIAMRSWAGADAVRVMLEGHGREDIGQEIDISRTVGWFTSMYPVLIQTGEEQSLGKQIGKVKESLRRIPNKGIGYGVLKYLVNDRSEGASADGILFNYLGQFDADIKGGLFGMADEGVGPFVNPRAKRAFGLEVNGLVSGGELTLTVSYSNVQYNESTIKQLLEHYRKALEAIIGHCISGEETTYTVSDFAYKDMVVEDLGVEDLDDLFND